MSNCTVPVADYGAEYLGALDVHGVRRECGCTVYAGFGEQGTVAAWIYGYQGVPTRAAVNFDNGDSRLVHVNWLGFAE